MPKPIPSIVLNPCPKGYTKDLDKHVSPEETIARVTEKLKGLDLDILSGTQRVDVGRLGIPVYMSMCGGDAKKIMPTRKQMGKGSSPAQAQASALMELMERYAFFSFWEECEDFAVCTFSEARRRFGSACIEAREITMSVHDHLSDRDCIRIMDCVRWKFYPATRIADGKTVWIPLDWFRLLSEFNGTSAGNTNEESILQGLSELIERHVCALVDKERMQLPTIDQASCDIDPVLKDLVAAFEREHINLVLKDFSLGMPLPTVAAIAWDPATFPERSEIVFTAGTATTPAKAAIRAVTEVAQLAGDFCTGACYEASGLPKFDSLEAAGWLLEGDTCPLSSLPSCEADDIRDELLSAVRKLAPINVYGIETTNRKVGIPAHYLVAPGLAFRERDKNQSIGLFVGRKVCEEQEPRQARRSLEIIASCYPVAHFLPFFAGQLAMREKRYQEAMELFSFAVDRQPEDDAKGLCAFYAGYSASLMDAWDKAEPLFTRAAALCPAMKEYFSYAGVARFKLGRYEAAADAFNIVIAIDKGSAIDLANLGMCEKRLGQTEEAMEHLAGAIGLDPSIEFAAQALAELKPTKEKAAEEPSAE